MEDGTRSASLHWEHHPISRLRLHREHHPISRLPTKMEKQLPEKKPTTRRRKERLDYAMTPCGQLGTATLPDLCFFPLAISKREAWERLTSGLASSCKSPSGNLRAEISHSPRNTHTHTHTHTEHDVWSIVQFRIL